MDAVIPFHVKDKRCIEHCVKGIRLQEVRNIYIVSKDNPNIDDTIWIDETIYPFTFDQIKSYVKSDRTGWYFQPLLKLYATRIIPGISKTVLIVDSDTVFFKPIPIHEDGKWCYFTREGIHEPYFQHMKYLHPDLGLKYPKSGIRDYMVMNDNILQEIFDLVETHHKRPFWEAFVSWLSHKDAGASEFEIYFHYIQRYPDTFVLKDLRQGVGPFYQMKLHRDSGYDYGTYHAYLG